MFKRRKPRSALGNTRELFWPSMGWVRAIKYTRLRIIRLSDSSHKIAAGLATGVSVSFSPILGTHFIQAGLISFATRTNFLASLIGTFVGTPWTFPFMWWAAISLGSFLFGIMGLPAAASLPDEITISILWEIARHEPMRIFMPWLLGGYLIALVSWPFSYFFFYNLVKGAKAARRKARLRKVRQVAKEMTGQKE